VAQCVSVGCWVIRLRGSADPTMTDLTSASDRSDWFGVSAS
jgi:hypothetical protein